MFEREREKKFHRGQQLLCTPVNFHPTHGLPFINAALWISDLLSPQSYVSSLGDDLNSLKPPNDQDALASPVRGDSTGLGFKFCPWGEAVE